MRITRPPAPALRPFVKVVWATDGASSAADEPDRTARERVLPTGGMHVVFRLSDDPLRVFDEPASPRARTIGHAIVGGARSTFYVRDVSQPARGVGAQLHPGAAPLLLGVDASSLAERHTRLDDLWGRVADEWRDRIAAAPSLERQLALFEALLASRLPRVRGVHPAVAGALAQLHAGAGVGEAVRASGYSHRHFVALFRDAVGLAPKLYGRVLRLQRVLGLAARTPRAAWASLALDAGYSDQAHLTRDFRELAGVTPSAYRTVAPESPNHVPVR